MTLLAQSQPAGPPGFHLRPATPADVPALAELFALAFPRERSVAVRAEELLRGGAFGDLTSAHVAEVDGALAGAIRGYPFRMHLQGRLWSTLGIASVAVSPGFRRRGVGRRMCRELLERAAGEGTELSALFPFRASYYAALGFVPAGELHRYRFDPRELPLLPGWDRVEWLDRGKEEVVHTLHETLASRTNGLLQRTPAMWRFLERDRVSVHLVRDGTGIPRGYLVASFGRGPEGGRLRIRELLAADRESRDALLGWIAAQRDQVGEVILDTLPGEEFHRRLGHPLLAGEGGTGGLWFPSALILRGPMLRVVDRGAVERWVGIREIPGEIAERGEEAEAAWLTERLLAHRPQEEGREPFRPLLDTHDFRMFDEF